MTGVATAQSASTTMALAPPPPLQMPAAPFFNPRWRRACTKVTTMRRRCNPADGRGSPRHRSRSPSRVETHLPVVGDANHGEGLVQFYRSTWSLASPAF